MVKFENCFQLLTNNISARRRQTGSIPKVLFETYKFQKGTKNVLQMYTQIGFQKLESLFGNPVNESIYTTVFIAFEINSLRIHTII